MKLKIALIAHDKKKSQLIALADEYKHVLGGHILVATGTTGRMINEATGLDINCLKSGPLGGDQQIGSMVAMGEIDIVLFMRDPLTSQPHEPDISALLRLCDVKNIPLATNPKGAKIILKAVESGDVLP